ncbi:hypothetical protein [Xanthomonas citri]|uniref:hypothetical protein n=1 Tax=Xanthomonas citri TaxID=346 RepID=UPI0004A80997|nr:hypothetical protein [Xanthomonas citri]QTK37314.1 hypothetical protein XcgCFBP7119R_12920 [Xanthomonas citri pv. glycines]
MHEDLIGRLTFALEKQKAGAFSYLFSEAIAALSAQTDPGSGGDARAQFEAWADSEDMNTRVYPHNGFYSHPFTRGAWTAWKHLAARKPVGEPVANRVIYPDGSRPSKWDSGKGYWPQVEGIAGTKFEYAFLPAPAAAVPVDERQDAAIVEAAKLAYGLLWMGTDLTGPDLAHRARVALRDALGKQACGEGINAARATHPQPAAATGVPELFVQWLEREMPAGTIIGKPAWWAPKLARALRSAERGVLGGCNG